MTTRKSLLFAALMLAGCGRMDREEEFRSVLPTKEMVEVKTPAKSGQGLMVDSVGEQSAQGQTSDLYTLTRGATVLVNGGTLAVLGLVDGVTKYQPTTLTEDTAVWGPHTEALARNTWKLTVKKTGDNTYSYTVSAKAKDAADSAFVDVIVGSHTAAVNEADEPMKGFGQGEFTLDWDKAQTLPEHDNNVGRMTVKYSRQDATSAVTVDAAFVQVKDGNDATKRVDANYGYKALPSQGGEFDFKLTQDWYKPVGSTPREGDPHHQEPLAGDRGGPLGCQAVGWGPGGRGHRQRVLGHGLRQPVPARQLRPASGLRHRDHELRLHRAGLLLVVSSGGDHPGAMRGSAWQERPNRP